MLDGHRTAERRSVAFHRLVAGRLDPALLSRTRDRVEGWLVAGGPAPAATARRWIELLDQPLPALRESLVADTEEMRQLRQNTPFAGAVPAGERWRIIREVR